MLNGGLQSENLVGETIGNGHVDETIWKKEHHSRQRNGKTISIGHWVEPTRMLGSNDPNLRMNYLRY